jgi:phosphotransferase system  glucose/maltose/N-acetylglucosamine-specific IIC component
METYLAGILFAFGLLLAMEDSSDTKWYYYFIALFSWFVVGVTIMFMIRTINDNIENVNKKVAKTKKEK